MYHVKKIVEKNDKTHLIKTHTVSFSESYGLSLLSKEHGINNIYSLFVDIVH